MGMGHDLIDDMAEQRRFPIQGGLTIRWDAASRAWSRYAAHFGTSQSLERIAERGGFGVLEYATLYFDLSIWKGEHATEAQLAQALREGDVRVEHG